MNEILAIAEMDASAKAAPVKESLWKWSDDRIRYELCWGFIG